MNYLIIGAGPAGVIAAETLRRTDPAGSVVLVGDEPEPPYSRMAIPYLLEENIGENGTHLRHREGYYDKLGIDVRQGRVDKVAPGDGKVTLDGGESLSFDRLLIATGSTPTKPPIPGIDLANVECCWTLEDARKIMAGTKKGSRCVLMGAGFIGCIILEALVERGVELTVIEMEDRMLPRMMDETGGDMIKRWCESKGVTVLTSTKVESIEEAGGGLRLALSEGGPVEADFVVCATGVAPNMGMIEGTGVETDDGILVDEYLQTGVEGVFAAGDVAQGPEFGTGKPVVHAIQPTASEHGRIAALNMAGQRSPYRGSLAMNVLNTIGLISSSFGQWQGTNGGDRAVITDADRFRYLRLEFDDDVMVGALALGLTQHVGVIRGLVQTRIELGPWKDKLMHDPNLVMSAYLDRTKGVA